MTEFWHEGIMAFTFRLEQVLAYRKQLEEQAMQTYGSAVAERDSVKSRIAEVQILLSNLRSSLTQSAGMSHGERWVARTSEAAYTKEVEDLYVLLKEKEQKVEEARKFLIIKAQERELLDTLKEKQAHKYALEQRLVEQRNNDETATLRFKPASY